MRDGTFITVKTQISGLAVRTDGDNRWWEVTFSGMAVLTPNGQRIGFFPNSNGPLSGTDTIRPLRDGGGRHLFSLQTPATFLPCDVYPDGSYVAKMFIIDEVRGLANGGRLDLEVPFTIP